jgi:hypothetical protein
VANRAISKMNARSVKRAARRARREKAGEGYSRRLRVKRVGKRERRATNVKTQASESGDVVSA